MATSIIQSPNVIVEMGSWSQMGVVASGQGETFRQDIPQKDGYTATIVDIHLSSGANTVDWSKMILSYTQTGTYVDIAAVNNGSKSLNPSARYVIIYTHN